MFHPLPLYVGLRYARARSNRYFVSFITWISLAGVGVGVAALIVILSVMNGFETELRDRLLALSAPVRISAPAGERPDWDSVRRAILAANPAAQVEPYAELQVLAGSLEMKPMLLRGAGDATRAELSTLLVEGTLAAMGEGGVVIGRQAAEELGVAAGDTLTLLVPVAGNDGLLDFDLRDLPVAAVFEAQIQDHDGTLVYASLPVLDALGVARGGATGLALGAVDALAAPAAAEQVRTLLATRWPGLVVTDWTQEHASYFRAIRIEKTMMALILLLIVAVAAFNIVAMLVMVVTDKRTDIAILRTFGASPRTVAGVFVAQGLVIGWLGVAAGVLLGVLIAANVPAILEVLYKVAGFTLFDADVYYIAEVPAELRRSDVLRVAGSALLLTLLATLYPARRAAATSPAEALRYE